MPFRRPLGLPSEVLEASARSADDIHFHIELRLRRDDLTSLEPPRRTDLNSEQMCDLASRIYHARREREKILDRKLFGEPGWDMLLALYWLPSRGERLAVTALGSASGASQTAALRWQSILIEDGLIERYADEKDGRRHFVRLTNRGRFLIEDYLVRIAAMTEQSGAQVVIRRDPNEKV